MIYMVVEHFKNKGAVAVYRRFRDSGRMAPEGLVYVSSWVDDKFERCYQVMETHDRRLLEGVDGELERPHRFRGACRNDIERGRQ